MSTNAETELALERDIERVESLGTKCPAHSQQLVSVGLLNGQELILPFDPSDPVSALTTQVAKVSTLLNIRYTDSFAQRHSRHTCSGCS